MPSLIKCCKTNLACFFFEASLSGPHERSLGKGLANVKSLTSIEKWPEDMFISEGNLHLPSWFCRV
jgi:hypothetical protein